MPKCFSLLGYVIFFWSNEGVPLEPIHIRVAKSLSQNATKIWILSDGSALLDGKNPSRIPKRDLSRIIRAVEMYSTDIISMWKEKFGVEPTYYDELS